MFGFAALPRLVEHLNSISRKIDRSLQVMLTMPAAPGSQKNNCRPEDHGRVVVISAVAFSNNHVAGERLHAPLDELFSSMPGIMSVERGVATDFESFYNNSSLMQTCSRWSSDNILTNDIVSVAKVIVENLHLSPSPESQPLIVWQGIRELPDAAYSAVGDYYVSTYAQWDDKESDEVNMNWLYRFYADLQAHASGFYINELDRERRPENIPICYSGDNWKKLMSLKGKYDPEHVFLGFDVK
ncbi:hypothetical protein C4K04_3678 [Pseudomonas chlororaphis]|uniref:Berberine/berberine-like domain-containing protein n=2 Tax=Pseudomonas chlororaphis TaxID=587753 RepID=A0A3G7TSE0_9PSED|nr:hypothetical protein C4K04_3678 [Pseudomonas chlororaphis]